MRKPDRYKRFNQRESLGDQPNYGNGVCYGLCVMLGSSIAHRELNGSTRVYEAIVGNIEDGSLVAFGGRYHEVVKQRVQEKPGYGVMKAHVPYLVKCHISYGWTGALWGTLHYVNYTWTNSANHACLIYRTQNDTVLFDPNWGVALWNGELPTTCGVLATFNTIADMIVYGYRKDCSVSVEGLEILQDEIRV